MRFITPIALFCTALVLLAAPALAQEQVRVVPAFEKLRFRNPLFLTSAPDGSDRLYVVEQRGRVVSFENSPDVEQVREVIDLRPRVQAGGEEGLLGLAFHPQFAANQQVFLHYTARGGQRNVLSRFRMSEAGTIDPQSEEIILEIEQPWRNHNGGMIAFGPDRMLYIALGDGGSGGDPHNNGQRLDTLLGKILRIDVDRREGNNAYAVPLDNPFAQTRGVRREIWAYGLRNPWRFSFDRKTGDLWAGDVGQNAWEEVDLIRKGRNYGWRVYEGTHIHKAKDDRTGPYEPPIAEYSHELGRSITGGYVYRGRNIPHLQGAYVYGDFVTGLVWSLRYDGEKVTSNEIIANATMISSFGEDRDGELYITSFDGRIYKLAPGS